MPKVLVPSMAADLDAELSANTAAVASKVTAAGQNYRNAYLKAFTELDGDIAGRLAAQHYLNNSTALYHDSVITMGFIPQIYSADELDFFAECAHTTYEILEAMTERYCSDASYRKLFGFSPVLEYLISLPTEYDVAIPITRIDIFCDLETHDFMFCEFNTDGSSAMNEDREICNALSLSETFKQASHSMELCSQELFDPWVEAFGEIYAHSSYEKKQAGKGKPTVALVDYQEKTTIKELEEFQVRFERAGYRCLICDVAGLSYQDGVLYGIDVGSAQAAPQTTQRTAPAAQQTTQRTAPAAQQTPTRIDAVYRRAVTSDIMIDLAEQEPDEKQTLAKLAQDGDAAGVYALIAAARDEAICLIGGFKTQVAHSKTAFRMLHHPETLAFLNEEQCCFVQEHVPFTTELSAETIAAHQVLENKQRFIIKPIDGYGTQGVYAGQSYGADEWDQLLNDCSHEGYVLQEYCPQYAAPNTVPIPLDKDGNPLFATPEQAAQATADEQFDPQKLTPFNLLTGLFVYGGKFAGVYMRAGADALIVGFRGGVTLGTFIADERGIPEKNAAGDSEKTNELSDANKTQI